MNADKCDSKVRGGTASSALSIYPFKVLSAFIGVHLRFLLFLDHV
jgi:hypothetical protein